MIASDKLVSASVITCNTPADAAGDVSVLLTNPDGQQSDPPGTFTYMDPAPTISSLSVDSAGVREGLQSRSTDTLPRGRERLLRRNPGHLGRGN